MLQMMTRSTGFDHALSDLHQSAALAEHGRYAGHDSHDALILLCIGIEIMWTGWAELNGII